MNKIVSALHPTLSSLPFCTYMFAYPGSQEEERKHLFFFNIYLHVYRITEPLTHYISQGKTTNQRLSSPTTPSWQMLGSYTEECNAVERDLR